MNEVYVSISFADGSAQEYEADRAFLSRLLRLQEQGLKGKRLVHELISDDWGPPPRSVEILGKDESGQEFKVQIPYT